MSLTRHVISPPLSMDMRVWCKRDLRIRTRNVPKKLPGILPMDPGVFGVLCVKLGECIIFSLILPVLANIESGIDRT